MSGKQPPKGASAAGAGTGAASGTPAGKRSRHGLSAEDSALWELVAAKVRPLPKDGGPAVSRAEASQPAESGSASADPLQPGDRVQPGAPVASPKRKAAAPRKTAAPQPPVPVPPLLPPRLPAIDRRTLQRLRRGLIPIEARLDLHGHGQDSAHAALLAFLRGASRAGKRAVLIITGKGAPPVAEGSAPAPEQGLSGRRRGVLRQAVPR